MNTIKMTLVGACVLTVVGAFAAEEDGALVEATEAHARWTFNVGYAWRANNKTSFRGSTSSRSEGGSYDNGSWNSAKDWSTTSDFDTHYDNPTVTGDKLNALALTRSDSATSGSEEDGMHGISFAAGYNFWGNEVVDIAGRLRFAGYWGLENQASGGYCNYTDYYAFNEGPSVGDGFAPEAGIDSAEFVEREYLVGSALSGTKTTLKSDLYQIGLGPQVTWHALSCLDVYGGVEALCNIINSDLNVGGASTSETNCRIGFGGNLGVVGYVTDWCGVFGQVGYEWIDKDDVTCKGISAETDYSSLVLSAGVQFVF